MQRFIIEENLTNIKTLADQMARKNFEFDIDNLKKEKLTENYNTKSNKLVNKKFPKKNSSIKASKENSSKKLNKNDLNSIINKSKNKLNQSFIKNDIPDSGKFQDINTNIINTNTNLNTNINTNLNTATNLNSRLNTNSNNNQINNEGNNNENEIYSDKNSHICPINENSSNISSNQDINKEINQNNNKNESEINESKNEIVKKEDNIIVEIVNPAFFKKEFDDSFDSINKNTKIKVNKKFIKSKMNKSTLYEREIRNRKRKNEKLEKKRKQLQNNEIKFLKQGPEIDRTSEQIIENKELYIPIDKRAAKIHSMKISQRILNEENKKLKNIEEENKQLYILKSNSKKFEQDNWDEFIERQYQWKNDVEYKKKAANVFRDNINKNHYFKPKINVKSKSIIKNIQNGNESFVDEVFIRLFNDFEEHNERQKFRNEQSLPTFKPKIPKNYSQKLLTSNLKKPHKSGTTSIINLRNNDNIKKKYNLGSLSGNGNKISSKAKSENLFYDIYNNNIEKFIDKIGNKKHISNKTQDPTQPTNNEQTKINYSDIHTDLLNSKYIIFEHSINKNKLQKNLSQCQLRPNLALLPLKIRNKIENKYNEEENNKNYSIYENAKKTKSPKNLNTYNTEGIAEKSNIDDIIFDGNNFYNIEEEKNTIKSKYNEGEELENKDCFENLNLNEYQIHKNKIVNINKNSNIIEKINDLERTRKFYGQSQNETINSDDSKFSENSLYKLNIRDSTPHLVKQDIILASKDFSDFFNVQELDDI